MNNKRYIKNYTLSELQDLVTEELKIPDYRADQIFTAIYKDRINDFSDITTLPVELRKKLKDEFYTDSFSGVDKKISSDGSVKFLYHLRDENAIEAVFMPWYNEETNEIIRNTLCISSQAGCALACGFCATGTLGLQRNLSVAEIVDQVIQSEKLLQKKIDNIVFMGMGEPLQNYENSIKAIDIFTNEKSKLISRKKIVLSTSGVVPKIYKLAELPKPVKLAISLHATTDRQREIIMPIAKKWPLKELMDAVENYYRKTKIPMTYEYIPFADFNDTYEDAKRLARISKRVVSKINLIPYNDISFVKNSDTVIELKPTSSERINEFAKEIIQNGGRVTVRDTFGKDIQGACGQLAIADLENTHNK